MPLLTARQVADELGVSPSTILRWTRQGKLKGIRLPSGAMRYRREDIEGWERARETDPPDCQGGLTAIS